MTDDATGTSALFGFSVTMTAKPGRGDELVSLLQRLNTGTLPAADPHCVLFVITRSAGNPDVAHVVEGWTSVEAHHTAVSTPEAKAVAAELRDLLDGDIERVNDGIPQPGSKLLI